MGDILKAKDMVYVAPLYLRGFACSDHGSAIQLAVYQSSRAETGELRERKVLCTLSELVAGLQERPLADVNQSVTCTERGHMVLSLYPHFMHSSNNNKHKN